MCIILGRIWQSFVEKKELFQFLSAAEIQAFMAIPDINAL